LESHSVTQIMAQKEAPSRRVLRLRYVHVLVL